MRCGDEHNSDVTDLYKLRIIREDRDKILAADKKRRHHQTFDNDAFEKAELKSLFASVDLLGAIILSCDRSACLTETVEHVV